MYRLNQILAVSVLMVEMSVGLTMVVFTTFSVEVQVQDDLPQKNSQQTSTVMMIPMTIPKINQRILFFMAFIFKGLILGMKYRYKYISFFNRRHQKNIFLIDSVKMTNYYPVSAYPR